MDNEIQLISDDQGLTVIGGPTMVEQFLAAEGLVSVGIDLQKLRPALGATSALTQFGSEMAANSGRWVKLTRESAHRIEKCGLRKSATTGQSTGVIRGSKGQIKGFVEFAKSPTALLTNPAILSGVGGIMAQMAMQQTLDEIVDYLERIEEKVDDVLRGQKDEVLSRVIGVDDILMEAMTTRELVGRVSATTWSKVDNTAGAIAQTQAYALLKLDDLAKKLETKSKIADVAKAVKDAEPQVREWLAVLAHCFQLQDTLAILELDRVLDLDPDDWEKHGLAVRTNRRNRIERITTTTDRLLARMDRAVAPANSKALFNPKASPAVVSASNEVSGVIFDFYEVIGVETVRDRAEARRWGEAMGELGDKVAGAGKQSYASSRRVGSYSLTLVKSAKDKISSQISERMMQARGDENDC